jgi:SAM-dependent methyltransferase
MQHGPSVVTGLLGTVGHMPPSTRLFTDRRRANSFGGAAQRYDAHRPGYPAPLIDDLLATGAKTALDVGAGTGRVARQLADQGVQVLAVEPDERMAEFARAKGIETEIATFETWDPAGRRFDLVTFAASFHWVDPAVALPKVTEILGKRGRLALLWNRLRAERPIGIEMDDIYRDYLEVAAYSRTNDTDGVTDALKAAGFGVALTGYPRTLQFVGEQWIELLFTYSSFLTLDEEAGVELRRRLAERIGSRELTVVGDSLAIVATPLGLR